MFYSKKISSVYRKCTVFQLLFKTNSYFCWLSFLHSVWVRKPKKWQQPVPDHFDGSEDFFSELFFWITVWRASKEQSNFFGTKSNLKGSPLTSKATNGYFVQGVWNWKKETSWGLKKTARTRTMKTLCELPAGAAKFPPDTRRNRRQSLPAEIFACIRWYFYLRNSLPAAIAGKFARASFTMNPSEILKSISLE